MISLSLFVSPYKLLLTHMTRCYANAIHPGPSGMEDAHAIVPSLYQGDSEEQSNAFFAVYDGHGGSCLLLLLCVLVNLTYYIV